MIIFSLILALVLLVGFIYLLRQHQERTRQEVVDREQPLPPLTSETAQHNPARESEPDPEISESEPPITVLPPMATDKADWRQTCQMLRDQGQYEAALETCRQVWPQWQSFDHAARVIRAAVRNSPTGTAEHQQWLHRLYMLAAQASFLHDKVDGMPEPGRQLLAQRFDPRQVDQLDMPWSEIGYRELRLLTKSDRRQLVQMSGEPQTHQSARIFHDKQWLTAIS